MGVSGALRGVLVLALAGGALTAMPPPDAEAATLQATLVATRSTSTWDRPSPDPSGITWDAATRQLIISDSEVDEMPLYAGTNLFLSSLTGVQASFPGGTTVPWSKEPTGISLDPASRSLYTSDDDQDRIYNVRPGGDGRYGTGDDTRTYFSTRGIGNGDPEDVVFDLAQTTDGNLLVIDGGDREVYEYTRAGVKVAQYDVYRHGARDPEGIAYHSGRDTVLVLDGRTQKIFEMTRQGQLLNVIGITAAKAVKAAGIALAPASNGSGAQHLYIVDRGIDNNDQASENDGRFYEMSVSLPPLDGGGSGAGGLGLPVVVGADDAEDRASGTTRAGTLQLAVDRSTPQTVGLRFRAVGVPQGATITNAYVQFQAAAVTTGAASLTVAGQAADNAPTFTTDPGNIATRPRTSATVNWTPAAWTQAGARGADQRTPDLKAVLQQIVSRSGWDPGNSLVLVVTGSGTRTAESYNTGGAAAAPVLHVEWTD